MHTIHQPMMAVGYPAPMRASTLGFGGSVGLAGLGLAALGGGMFGQLARLALPVGGAYLGYTHGADLLRQVGPAQTAVGWLARSPIGAYLGHDPFRPVGGALGALAGFGLGRMFF